MSGKSDFNLTIDLAVLQVVVELMNELPPVQEFQYDWSQDEVLAYRVLKAYENYVRSLAVEPNFKVVSDEQN